MIDYTNPYIDVGLQFAQKKQMVESDTFEFLKPFSANTWITIIVTWLVVSIILTLLEKCSPYGRHGEFVQTPHDLKFYE